MNFIHTDRQTDTQTDKHSARRTNGDPELAPAPAQQQSKTKNRRSRARYRTSVSLQLSGGRPRWQAFARCLGGASLELLYAVLRVGCLEGGPPRASPARRARGPAS